MIIGLLLFCIFIILLGHCVIHYGRFGQLINQLPGEPLTILIGHALDWGRLSLGKKNYIEILILIFSI